MIVWIDAQLPPSLARWLSETFEGVEAYSALYLDLLRTPDVLIFEQAAATGAVVMTKDVDFARLVVERGAPPQVVWIRSGNTSASQLRALSRPRFRRRRPPCKRAMPLSRSALVSSEGHRPTGARSLGCARDDRERPPASRGIARGARSSHKKLSPL